jgi:alkanesulfonate monooxygenase SsuD/methylene tetrahydromethanopterin reductase-like flavin-dependent oxidoreductase (luciferase family)
MAAVASERQPRGLGFALRDPYPADDLASLARAGESLGYAALFMPEIGARDTLAAIEALGDETRDLLMGPGVAPLPARTPRELTTAAARAQDACGGRLLLGLGTGPARPGALDRLRETVVGVRAALRGEPARVGGEVVRADPVPTRPVPVWIAALGPRAVRLAGEVADGVLLNWCTPERVAAAATGVAAAATAAGRDPAEVTIGVYVRAAQAGAEAPARAALLDAARTYGGYPAYARQFTAMGIDPADPEAIVDAVCLAGAGAAARVRLDAYRDAGAHLPVVYPVVAWDPTAPEAAASAAGATLEALAPKG